MKSLFHHIKVIFRGDRKEDGIKCYAAAIFALHKRQHSAPIGVKKAAYSLALAVILLLVDLFSFFPFAFKRFFGVFQCFSWISKEGFIFTYCTWNLFGLKLDLRIGTLQTLSHYFFAYYLFHILSIIS